MKDERLQWMCREILHAGEGPPCDARLINVGRPASPSDAAEAFVAQMHDRQKGRDYMEDADFDGDSSIVEVLVGDGQWKRFLVKCRVVRQYDVNAVAADFVS